MTPAFTYDHPKRIAGANRERRLYVEVAPRQFLTHLIDAVLHALTSRYHHLTLTVAARACRRSAAALFRALTQRTLARRRCAIRTRATARARARRQSQADSWCRHANAVSFPCGRARERAPATAPVARSVHTMRAVVSLTPRKRVRPLDARLLHETEVHGVVDVPEHVHVAPAHALRRCMDEDPLRAHWYRMGCVSL